MTNTTSRLFFIALLAAFTLSGCGEQTSSTPPKTDTAAEPTPEQKFAATLEKAKQGDATAQFNLAQMYRKGEGVAKDLTQAAEWYHKAAEQGLAQAQFNLAEMYYKGEGVAKDLAQAAEWYRKAAEQGLAQAQFNLALMYDNGEGVAKDLTQAAEWYRKAAEQGDAKAQSSLGWMYSLGEGVAKDLTQAVEWYRKAAEQGLAEAQFNLAGMYYIGIGVAKDLAQAAEWYRKAAEQGLAQAQFNLALMYDNGEGVAKDLTQAAEWYRKAAEKGDAKAQHNLAVMYYKGEGVGKDDVLAYAWANLAAAQGEEKSKDLRGILERSMTKQALQEAQQLSSQWKKGQAIVRAGAGASNAPVQVGPAKQPATLQKRGNGTAFIVSKRGLAVTNYHVVEGCTELRIEGREGAAKLVTDDKVNDLALLQLPGPVTATAVIAKEPQKVRQGEDIVVFGFPLNFVLSSGGNLTPGVISALTGLGNNTNQLQITAPIQPGSSGSPVLNKKGEVIGVVSMKLSDKVMAKETGSVGQNVNFAVSGQTLKSFLDTHSVDYRTAGLISFEKSPADLADEARKWTTVVECWK